MHGVTICGANSLPRRCKAVKRKFNLPRSCMVITTADVTDEHWQFSFGSERNWPPAKGLIEQLVQRLVIVDRTLQPDPLQRKKWIWHWMVHPHPNLSATVINVSAASPCPSPSSLGLRMIEALPTKLTVQNDLS
jgi:hypothetical protein